MGTVRGKTFNFRLYAGDVDSPAHAHVLLDKGQVVVDISGTEATLREIRGSVSDSNVRKIIADANDCLDALKLEWTRMHP